MFDLRFVNRDMLEWDGPEFAKIKTFRVLQWRQVSNPFEVNNELQPPIWGEWEDVRLEEEPTDER